MQLFWGEAIFFESMRCGWDIYIIFMNNYQLNNCLIFYFKIFTFLRIVSPNQHVAATFTALSNNSIQQHVPRLTCSQHFDRGLARGVFSLFRWLSTLVGLSRLTGFLPQLSLWVAPSPNIYLQLPADLALRSSRLHRSENCCCHFIPSLHLRASTRRLRCPHQSLPQSTPLPPPLLWFACVFLSVMWEFSL